VATRWLQVARGLRLSDQPEGTVVSQSPAGGDTARKRTRIRLNTSLGPTPGAGNAVPRVTGLSPQTATARLRSAGFEVQRLTQTTASQSQDGLVVDEQPIGANVPAGSTVTIYVGSFSG